MTSLTRKRAEGAKTIRGSGPVVRKNPVCLEAHTPRAARSLRKCPGAEWREIICWALQARAGRWQRQLRGSSPRSIVGPFTRRAPPVTPERKAPSVLISIQCVKGHRPTIPIPMERRVFHARLLGLWCHDAKPICGALAQSCSPDFGQFLSCCDFGVQHIRTSENQYWRQTGTGTKRIAREQLGRKTARRSFVRSQRSNGSFPCPRPNSTCPATGAKCCSGSRGSSTTAFPTETVVSRRSIATPLMTGL